MLDIQLGQVVRGVGSASMNISPSQQMDAIDGILALAEIIRPTASEASTLPIWMPSAEVRLAGNFTASCEIEASSSQLMPVFAKLGTGDLYLKPA